MAGDPAPRRDLERALDRLSFSADAKAIISRIGEVTLDIGGKLIAIGRNVLTFALQLIGVAPGTAFGAILGAVLSALISSVPVFGWLFGPMLAPLLMTAGIGLGALADFASGTLGDRIQAFVDTYAPLAVAN